MNELPNSHYMYLSTNYMYLSTIEYVGFYKQYASSMYIHTIDYVLCTYIIYKNKISEKSISY